jgi:hypothetical protein
MITEEELMTILNLFDPEGLLRLGAPEYEYQQEAEMIANSVKKLCSSDKTCPFAIKKIVSDVFCYQFARENAAHTEEIANVIVNLISYRNKYRKNK